MSPLVFLSHCLIFFSLCLSRVVSLNICLLIPSLSFSLKNISYFLCITLSPSLSIPHKYLSFFLLLSLSLITLPSYVSVLYDILSVCLSRTISVSFSSSHSVHLCFLFSLFANFFPCLLEKTVYLYLHLSLTGSLSFLSLLLSLFSISYSMSIFFLSLSITKIPCLAFPPLALSLFSPVLLTMSLSFPIFLHWTVSLPFANSITFSLCLHHSQVSFSLMVSVFSFSLCLSPSLTTLNSLYLHA